MPEKPDHRRVAIDPDAAPTHDERMEAERLRIALENPAMANEDAALARALAAAWSQRDLSAAEHRALVDRALDSPGAARRPAARWLRLSFASAAVVALAAGFLLSVSSGDLRRRTASEAAPSSETIVLAVTRSTQPLFPEHFAPTGGATGRIDRIAMARAADLRENEFAKWGVR
jgi:hypothetical protein